MDRYGVEGVQLVSTQPIGLQVNRRQRQDKEDRRHNRDKGGQKDKKNKDSLKLKDQVTLMLKPSKRPMLEAPLRRLALQENSKTSIREGPKKKKIDIKV